MVVLVPEDVLRRTPSRAAGVSAASERLLRAFGAELILRAASLLRLPQTTAVSGTALLQRFYFRRSLCEFEIRTTAQAALLLACKLEETHRRLRDIVVVFHRLRVRSLRPGDYEGIPTPCVDGDMADMKQVVISIERHMLREFGFAVAALLEHPHKYVLQFVKSLKRTRDADLAALAQAAWNCCNDSTRTSVCCEHQPHEIAAAAIYMAAAKVGLKLPSDPPWYAVFDCSLQVLRRIARTVSALYRRPPLSGLEADESALLVRSSQRGASARPASPSLPETPAPLPSPLSEDGGTRAGERREAEAERQAQETALGREALETVRLKELLVEHAQATTAPRQRSRSRGRERAPAFLVQ